MKTIMLFSLVWLFSVGIVFAKECPVGYEPPVAAFSFQSNDLKGMELSEADRMAAEGKLASFKASEDVLLADYRSKDTEIVMMLAEKAPDRSKIDAAVTKLMDMVQELGELRMTHTFEMTDLLKAGNLKKVRSRPRHQSSYCDGLPVVPRMRFALTGKEREIIGITEDEIRYLNDFERRELSFRADQQSLRLRLDRALRAKDVDRVAARALLMTLVGTARQRVTNRLDRYFYADQVLFSSIRMEKLNALHAKRVRRVKPERKAK